MSSSELTIDADRHGTSRRVNLLILAALLSLLAATMVLAFVPVGGHWSVLLALTIAAAKALLIALYFMHLRDAARLTIVAAVAGFVWLAILFVLMLSDYTQRT